MPKVSFRMASASRESVLGVQINTARKIHRSDHTEGRLTTAPSGCCVRKGTSTGFLGSERVVSSWDAQTVSHPEEQRAGDECAGGPGGEYCEALPGAQRYAAQPGGGLDVEAGGHGRDLVEAVLPVRVDGVGENREQVEQAEDDPDGGGGVAYGGGDAEGGEGGRFGGQDGEPAWHGG